MNVVVNFHPITALLHISSIPAAVFDLSLTCFLFSIIYSVINIDINGAKASPSAILAVFFHVRHRSESIRNRFSLLCFRF